MPSLVNPGFHQLKVGDATVVALNDGQFQASTAIVRDLAAERCEALLREAFRPLPPRVTVNCFLVHTGGKRVLVDAGAGNAAQPALGHAAERLAALGIAPATIDTVLITHAHFDHVQGLLDGTAAAFPNAELVISAAEAAHCLDAAGAGGGDGPQRAFGPYAQRLRRVNDGTTVLPGIIAHALPGHTPGHTGWLLNSGDEALLFWGDVVHLPAIQFAHPEVTLTWDDDPAQARASRMRVLEMAVRDRLLVAGVHLDFPACGHVRRVGTAYGFEPVVWAPTATGPFPA